MAVKRDIPEYKKKLVNGTLLYINQIGDDRSGKKCFLVSDKDRKYESFVITADCLPLNGEVLEKEQQWIVLQIKHFIKEISEV